MHNNDTQPRRYFGVTISSTFKDLEEHRAALIKALGKYELKDIAMENDAAKSMDIIDSSLKMVRDGAAYIGLIGKRYGQTPICPKRNPRGLSITELEFDEAIRLGRPILLFIMGDKHPILETDIETNTKKKKKLNAFRERAKEMGPDSSVHRVYATFNSLDEFKEQVGPSILSILDQLKDHTQIIDDPAPPADQPEADHIPRPPALYAEPEYIGSNKFVGRGAQLDALDDWARPADEYAILLFDAIGGAGKSMLTWHWTKHHAVKVRNDWAGIFWYSFYEKGAVMADFCQRALAYITGTPLKTFRKKKTLELREQLLYHLKSRPWLFILDGLERVLVAYHRIDAAEIPDEELNTPTDKIVNRNPCACINDEDDELLRSLATAAPSKLLVSSRLVPRVLFNAASQPIPGVQRIALPGLRPPDAEVLFRTLGVFGDSNAIQSYLTTNCDCHPLTIGVLAGLINNYPPDKGNFDTWIVDPLGGGDLDLASLDLVQRRNHILKAAMRALSDKSRQLLSTLALLAESVDYRTLSAFNPHLLPEPEEVSEPTQPERLWRWPLLSDEEKAKSQKQYLIQLKEWKAYKIAIGQYHRSSEYRNAPKELERIIHDLETRGLLQYDHNTKRYDLHPVVRGVAAGGLKGKEKEQFGQTVVDHFSAQAHDPYDQAETLEDLQSGVSIVRTLIKMEHYQDACDILLGDLSSALIFNLEANKQILSLIKAFFPNGWHILPTELNDHDGSLMINLAAMALDAIGELSEGLLAWGVTILQAIESRNSIELGIRLRNVSVSLFDQRRYGSEKRILDLTISITDINNNRQSDFLNLLDQFEMCARFGETTTAEALWEQLDPMGRNWARNVYRPGAAEYCCTQYHFWNKTLNEDHLATTEHLAINGKNRILIRKLHKLRGGWYLENGLWEQAVQSFSEAVRMARAIGLSDTVAETGLALAKSHFNILIEPLAVARELALAKEPAHQYLAELWLAIGESDQAKKHALNAYKEAWADGEPFVHRYNLNKAIELLNRLGVEIPKLPPYDPAKDIKLPWEDKVREFIEQQKTEKEQKKNSPH